MTRKPKKPADDKFDLQSSLEKIETVIGILERQDTSLDDSLSAFEKGIELTRSAQKKLSAAEQRVTSLLEADDGHAIHSILEDQAEQ